MACERWLRSLAMGDFLRLRVVFPLRGPGSHRAEHPEKWGKITKFPSPVRPPKLGKNYRTITKLSFWSNLPLFSGNFPFFRGSERGGEFCNFSPFFADFRPGGFPGPLQPANLRTSRWMTGHFWESGGIVIERPRWACQAVPSLDATSANTRWVGGPGLVQEKLHVKRLLTYPVTQIYDWLRSILTIEYNLGIFSENKNVLCGPTLSQSQGRSERERKTGAKHQCRKPPTADIQRNDENKLYAKRFSGNRFFC